jgi:hypothetical protein
LAIRYQQVLPRQTLRLKLYIFYFFLQSISTFGQTKSPDDDNLCSLIANFHRDSSFNCIYDTVALVDTHIKNTSVIFAVRSIDIKGTSTPFCEVFVLTNGKLKPARTDTLITNDCFPCHDPRDFDGISVRVKDGKKQVLLSCSYFYSRQNLAGTVYRKFVYEFSGNPIKIIRDKDSEEKFKSADVGEVTGE